MERKYSPILQISDYLELDRDAADEDKVTDLRRVHAEGEKVWVKVSFGSSGWVAYLLQNDCPEY